jgi:hypothetical protein
VFYYEERTFHFGTLVPSKHPDGITEKFKIINSNKIPCTVKFKVESRTKNVSEPNVFSVKPEQITINAHDHYYVEVNFKPTIMAQYVGYFDAVVENGE